MTRNRDIHNEIRAVNPVALDAVEHLDLDQAKDQVFAGIVSERPEQTAGRTRPKHRRQRDRNGPLRARLALGAVASVAVAAVLVAIGFGLGSTGSPTPALGAAFTRLARVSPHILLQTRGWRAEAAYLAGGESGAIYFHRADGAPERLLGGRLVIIEVDSAELAWRRAPGALPERPKGKATYTGSSPTLGIRARIYSRPLGGNAGTKYLAVWTQTGRRLEFSSIAPDLSTFRGRLSALGLVGRDEWLAALPGRLVRAGGTVASKPWGEPASSSIVAESCSTPLPGSVRAAASSSQIRLYEHQCGHTMPAGRHRPTARESGAHPGAIVVTRCHYPSEEASLNATTAMNERLEAEGRCSTERRPVPTSRP